MPERAHLVSDKATLAGIAAKIRRADEHISTLDAEFDVFLKEHYQITGSFDSNLRKYTFTALGSEALPTRFAVIVGEVAHHLRSALDHLVTQLQFFGAGDGKPDVLEFPICRTPKQFEEACRRGKLTGIPEAALKTIGAVQPYRTSEPVDSSALAVLHELDRIDKHRLLLVVVACVQMANTLKVDATRNVTITGMSPPIPPGVRPTKEGRAIFDVDFGEEFDPNISIDGNFGFQIVFDQPGVLMNLPVVQTLKKLRETVAVGLIQRGFFPDFTV